MTKFRDELKEHLDEETLFLGSEKGEFDPAIVGVFERDGHMVLVYDEHAIIEALEAQGMTDEDAWDWYGFNILGAHLGPHTRSTSGP